jgi:hypothetical protein
MRLIMSRAATTVTAFLLVLSTTLVLRTPAAHADVPPGYPEFGQCTWDATSFFDSESWGRACFEYSGDDFWIQDRSANGWSVRAQIEDFYGAPVRWCVNSESAPNWHECRYDMPEYTLIRWRLFEQDGPGGPTRRWTAWSDWYCVSSGTPLSANLGC